MIDEEQRKFERQEDSTKDPAHVGAAPATDCATQDKAALATNSHRTLAFAVAVPALLIVGIGSFYVFQNTSPKGSQSRDLEGAYAALEQSLSENAVASIHGDDVGSLIERLEARLKTDPDDVDGWRVLGWSHFRSQRFEKAAEAYGRAEKLNPGSAMLKSLRGEALVAAANGKVTNQALDAFKSAIALDPSDVRAQFYSGQAELQNGNAKSALDIWIDLLKTAPKETEWATDLRERILQVSRESGTDVSASLPLPQEAETHAATKQNHSGPTANDIKNASKLTPQAREAMARSMVERLAKRLEGSPNDPDGWIMLIRSRMVLNDSTEATAAFKRAMDIFANNPEVKERIRLAAQALNVTSGQ